MAVSLPASHPQQTGAFPFLDNVSKNDKERLKLETKKIIDKFVILVDKVKETVNTDEQDVEELKLFLAYYPKIYRTIYDIKNFNELWQKVSSYWSFFDYGLIKLIIEARCPKLIEMTEYENKFKWYCQRRLCEVPTGALNYEAEVKNCLHLKFDKRFCYRYSTLNDIKKLQCELSKLLGTNLLLLKVEDHEDHGCLELVFSCLTSLTPYPLHRMEQLKRLGIIQMCDNGRNYFNDEMEEKCKPTVSGLYYLLKNLSAHWKKIGRELKIPTSTLDMLTAKNGWHSYDRCMIDMFETWIMGISDADCEWSSVVTALRKIGQGRLANTVKEYVLESPTIKFNWLSQADKEQGTKITDDDDIYHILVSLMEISNRWYEFGCLLKLEKNYLDEIERVTLDGNSIPLFRVLKKLSELNKLTWAGLQFILEEMGLIKLAERIEQLPKQTADAIGIKPKVRRQLGWIYYDEIRNRLQVPDPVSDDFLLKNLHHYYSKMKEDSGLTENDIVFVTGCVKTIVELDAGHIEVITKELKEEFDWSMTVKKKLSEASNKMEYSMKVLSGQERDITRKLNTPEGQQEQQLLEQRLESVKETLNRVREDLKKCRLKIKEVNDEIGRKLRECKESLCAAQQRLDCIKENNNLMALLIGGGAAAIALAIEGGAAGAVLGGGVLSVPGALIGAAVGASIAGALGLVAKSKSTSTSKSLQNTDSLQSTIRSSAKAVEAATEQVRKLENILSSTENH